MSKPSDAAQRAKKELDKINTLLASTHTNLETAKSEVELDEAMIHGLERDQRMLEFIINGDKPEPPAMIGTATEPPSEGDAPRQKRKYTRKIGGLTAQSTHKEMTDTGATGDVPVVRAKAKEQKTQEASSLATHYCHDCASDVAVTVKIVKGEEVTTCRECGSLQVEPLM
jgi:hypothetical protein